MSSFLITDYLKIKFSKNSNLVFKDEYLQNLYSKKFLKNYKYCFIENLNQVFNKDKKISFIKKKTKKYLNNLHLSLNKLHNVNLNNKDWGILIEYYILISVIAIKKRYDFLNKVKKKNFKIISLNADFTFETTADYKKELLNKPNLNLYVNYLISNQLNLNSLSKKKIKIKYFNKKRSKPFQKLIYILNFLFIKFFKPYLIVDGYLGIKNSLIVFLKSKFQFLFVNENYLKKKSNLYKKNDNLRNSIKIKIEDRFDEIFEIYIRNTLPGSFLENFQRNLNNNEFLSKNLKKMGTAIHLAATDEFKFLAMNLKKQNKKIFNIQHGGQFGERKFSPENFINNKYSNLNIFWNDKNTAVGPTYFNSKKISNKIERNKILFFPSQYLLKEEIENLRLNNNIYLNQYLGLLRNLNKEKFNDLYVKFFSDNIIAKKMWKKKLGSRITFLKKNYKGSIFNKSDIVIIDNFSTAFYELLFYEKPFFIICKSNLAEFRSKFSRLILNLRKINLLFEDEEKLAHYLNKNQKVLNSKWLKTVHSKEYKAISNYIFPMKKFNYMKFIKLIDTI